MAMRACAAHRDQMEHCPDELRTPIVSEYDGHSPLTIQLDADGSMLWYLPSVPLQGKTEGGDMLSELEACLERSQVSAADSNRWVGVHAPPRVQVLLHHRLREGAHNEGMCPVPRACEIITSLAVGRQRMDRQGVAARNTLAWGMVCWRIPAGGKQPFLSCTRTLRPYCASRQLSR